MFRKTPFAAALLAALTATTPSAAAQRAASAHTQMRLDVDATNAPMKIIHATVTMPAKPGAMSLFYPTWIPGEHLPSGPVQNLNGLHILADGKELDWRRDLVEMNAIALIILYALVNISAASRSGPQIHRLANTSSTSSPITNGFCSSRRRASTPTRTSCCRSVRCSAASATTASNTGSSR